MTLIEQLAEAKQEIERLRKALAAGELLIEDSDVYLRLEIERLRAALERIAKDDLSSNELEEAYVIARAALEGK